MSKFVGRWRIKWMELWDQEFVDLVEPGYFQLDSDGLGFFVFGAVEGQIDYRVSDVESESSFHGLGMMMAARNPGVVGFGFNLHA